MTNLRGVRTWLSPAGTAAAVAVGGAVLAGTGWRGFAVLAAFLVTGSLLTPGGGRRRAVQVVANGGVAALCALLALADPRWTLAFGGAVAAAAADTWSTELGGRSGAVPRLITTWRRVEPGTSGGVTLVGTLGGLGGAIVIGALARLVGLVTTAGAGWTILAGFAGCLADSLLGATVQIRYRCAACGALGESSQHGCGGTGLRASGITAITNDTVNFLATLVGAAVAVVL